MLMRELKWQGNTIITASLDGGTMDNKRILCRIADIAGSKEQPGYKLPKGLHPLSTSIQQSQGHSTSINKTLNEIAATSNKVGVSCNCKKGCGTRCCRCYKNDLKCSIYRHSTVYERTEVNEGDRSEA